MLGHVLRMPEQQPGKIKWYLRWTPQGELKRGRPKITWQRSVEAELKDVGLTCESASKQEEDWQKIMEILGGSLTCHQGVKEDIYNNI